MIEGVSFSYPASDEVYADPNVLRFAKLEPGEPLRGEPARYWRSFEGSETLADNIAAAAGIRSQKLTGFTLFMHPGKGWQMSIRRDNELGWDVTFIPDEQARAVFSVLENHGHPDGPFRVNPQLVVSDETTSNSRLIDAVQAATSARGVLTTALFDWAANQ